MKDSWSYSEYSMAVSCLAKYNHAVILKTKPDYTSGDMSFGTAIHAGINAMLEGGDGESVFESLWLLEESIDHQYGRYNWEALAPLGKQLLTKFRKYRLDDYKLEVAEKRLYAEYKGLKLEGTPDFIGLFEGKRSLRDFKTSGYTYPKEKAIVALQLNLYAYLAITSLGWTPETLGYDVLVKSTGGLQRPMSWQFDELTMYAMLDDFVNYANKLNPKIQLARNPNACIVGSNVCQYFKSCWKESLNGNSDN